MKKLMQGLKLITTQFYQATGLLIPATLILIKVIKNYYNFNSKINECVKNYFFISEANALSKTLKKKQPISDSLLKYSTWDFFKKGKILQISGKKLGKGTIGNVKRYNFSRGPITHGSKHVRLQGSLGSGTTPGRTLPGKRMSGHSKNYQFIKSEILLINPKENFIFVKGSTPGKQNNLLYLS